MKLVNKKMLSMNDIYTISPWHDLPTQPSYVLPKDLEYIKHHRNFPTLQLDTLPGQFAGGLDTAEVIFLALNPGSHETDTTINLHIPEFVRLNRRNHVDAYSSAFYYLGSGLEKTAVYSWWARVLKPFLQDGIKTATLERKIMLVNYFPYHSVKWKSLPLVPSQQFAFDLVREAIKRNKIIVIMRSERLWIEAVPELVSYEYMVLKNKRNVVISPNNLGQENYDLILAVLNRS